MELSNEQLTELINLVDIKLDRMATPLTPETEFQKMVTLLEALRSELATKEATVTERPRLATYTVLTGTTYEVEATSEEEALEAFHNWYGNGEDFHNVTVEEGEALTVVTGHD
jgi:hypothetical protein